MKLVFQIAGGIVLAAIIMFIGSSAIGFFAAKSLNESIKNVKIQNENRMREAQIQRERQKKEQSIRNQKAIEQSRIRNLKLDRELRAKAEKKAQIRKEWNKFYKIPYQCKYMDTDSIRKWCNDYRISAKKEFNQKVKNGSIKLL